jgi:hypothetical protein
MMLINPIRVRDMSPEQYAAAMGAIRPVLAKHYANFARANREKREAFGVTEYRWHSCSTDCRIARKNHGKKFSSERPPKEGHPQEGTCYDPRGCLCSAVPVVWS